jgi:hypothetical protein
MSLTILINESNFELEISSFREIRDKDSTGLNSGALLMSMLESDHNSVEYKLTAAALQNNLLKQMSEDTKTYICPHSEWFGHPSRDEIKVDATVCRFCGIKKRCVLFRPVKRIELTIKGYRNEFPPQEELEKCFAINDTRGENSKIDPFVGFSLEAKLSRDLYVISKSSFDSLFIQSDTSKYHPTALHNAIGFELHTGTPLWPIDQRFLQLRLEMKHNFNRAISNYESNKNKMISEVEYLFVIKIALKWGWISPVEKNLFPALRHLFDELTTILKQIRTSPNSLNKGNYALGGIEQLSNSSMKPMVDIPFSENCTGIIELALRWTQLCPHDIEQYLVHCNKEHQTFEDKKMIVQRITGEVKKLEPLATRELSYWPRLPMVVLAREEHLPLINLNTTNGRVIDLVIADVSEPFYLIDPLGKKISRMWNND